jgi:hypothetical protein
MFLDVIGARRMPLSMLVAREPMERPPLVFADPTAVCIEPLLTALIPGLGPVHRVVFPLPDDTTRRYFAPPRLVRSRHADLWYALNEDERQRALLLAGPSAAYLTPALGAGATVIVAVSRPNAMATPGRGAWRAVLGAFPSLDELPDDVAAEEERGRWLERIRADTAALELVRTTDLDAITREVGLELGLRPKVAERAGLEAKSAGPDPNRVRERSGHWVDEILYSLGRPPRSTSSAGDGA